jgi:hypothetical protein
MFMQGFLIFMPCVQVYKNRRLETETRQIIAEWEHKKQFGTSLSSDSTKANSKAKFSLRSAKSNTSTRSGEMYTMATLEKTLRLNSKPLLLFAALKDFSGENISFLAQVNEWKQKWSPISPRRNVFGSKVDQDTPDEKALRRSQFILAAHIYSSFVSLHHSDFPINISSAHLKELEILFDDISTQVNGEGDNSATPFDSWSKPGDLEHGTAEDNESDRRTLGGDSTTAMMMTCPERKHYSTVQAFQLSNIVDNLPADLHIPASFGEYSFDNAEKSIKELVLTNTWPKFVNAGYANSMQQQTFKEKLVSYRDGINAYSTGMARTWNKGVKKLEITNVPPKPAGGAMA